MKMNCVETEQQSIWTGGVTKWLMSPPRHLLVQTQSETEQMVSVFRASVFLSINSVSDSRTLFFSLSAASDHRVGAADSRSLHLQREGLQLLRIRSREQGFHVQISFCLLHFIRPAPAQQTANQPYQSSVSDLTSTPAQ